MNIGNFFYLIVFTNSGFLKMFLGPNSGP